MSVSAALVSSFVPFTYLHICHSRIKRTSRFAFLYFGFTHDFTILSNSHEVFPHHRILGQGLKVAWQQLAQMFFFNMSCTVSSLKTFPYGWDWRRVWTLSISHIPSPLECLPSSIWTFGLRVWFAPRHFQILFFQSHPTFFHCIYLFSKKCLPRNALLWSWCIQSDGLRLESRWSFYCVIPWLVDVV